MEKRIIESTIVVISIIVGVTGFTTSDVSAMECTKNSNSSFEMILSCTDTIDVRKSTMEYMYIDINKFSSSFEGATIYNVKTKGSDTFATLKILLPLVSALQSDVKFSKSTNYLLEFLNGKLGGSKLYINLYEINGYDGTKNGGTLVNFTFQIKDVPCFLMGLKCGSASDFKYVLDRGLLLMEPEAKEIQLKLDQESNYQNNQQEDTQKSTPTNNQQTKQETIETQTEKITLQDLPRVYTNKDGMEDSVDKCIFDKEIFNGYLDDDDCPDMLLESKKAEKNLPNWIKNNAAWWSSGAIIDQDFSKGIEFMIKEGIIRIPQIQSEKEMASFSVGKLPDWIKNNAKWWSEGKLSDEDFSKGIEHMIKEGIIFVQIQNSYSFL